MTKFKEGDLVICSNNDDDRTNFGVMRVLEAQEQEDNNYHNILVAIGNDDDSAWYPEQDLELVKEEGNITIQVAEPTNIPFTLSTRTMEDVNQDIEKLFITVFNYLHASLEGERVHLSISSEMYGEKEQADVNFSVTIQHRDPVKTNDLQRSAEIALDRFSQDKVMKPRKLTFFGGSNAA